MFCLDSDGDPYYIHYSLKNRKDLEKGMERQPLHVYVHFAFTSKSSAHHLPIVYPKELYRDICDRKEGNCNVVRQIKPQLSLRAVVSLVDIFKLARSDSVV